MGTSGPRIYFRYKSIRVKKNPRAGVCKWCGRKNGDIYINKKGKPCIVLTGIHHIQYHDDDPLKDTIELCQKCHGGETKRINSEKHVPLPTIYLIPEYHPTPKIEPFTMELLPEWIPKKAL